jgi:hypothetical protein
LISAQRFIRQYKIWKELFVKDKGTHILPVLGWVEKGHNTQKDPYVPCSPYLIKVRAKGKSNRVIITPRSKHYNAFLYVKETETQYALMGDSSPIDYISLVRHRTARAAYTAYTAYTSTFQILMVARGLRVLHTMDPPIYHGDVRGENIEIAPCGRPLLANFWFSKVIITPIAQDATHANCSTLRPMELLKGLKPVARIGSALLHLRFILRSNSLEVMEKARDLQTFGLLL